VLDTNSPDLLGAKEFAAATRARLLAKLRDEVRRAKDFRTTRNGLGSRSEAVEMMVRAVMEAYGGRASAKD
jgi:hypothetical protein